MKKLLFMVINMNIGGTEKSLLNILNELSKDKYEITLLMLEKYGGFLDTVPKHVKVKYLDDYEDIKGILNNPPVTTCKEFLKKGHLIKSFNIIFYHIVSKISEDRSIYFKYVLKDYSDIDNEYDVAVAFAGPMDFISYYIINKVNSHKKVQWVHFDVTKIGFNVNFSSKIYNKFDKVFVVSEEGKDKLLTMIPSIKFKTDVFHNIVSPKVIKEMSNKGNRLPNNFEGIKILTVGRLSKEKGQHLTIPVLARLRQEGYDIRWYCVGEGIARSKYEQLVKQYNVENDYVFLGSHSNPYTMMKECDIYVQSSIHEGFCITLAEARCFNAPIITTNFTGANEQIIHGKTGLISDISEEDLYINIKKILDDMDLKNNISKNLELYEPDTRNEVLKLEHIINS